MTDKNTLNVLILGISGCGKTTFTKQMKILHMQGFQDFETDNFRKIILRNIASGIHELILKLLESDYKLSEKNEESVTFIRQNPSFVIDDTAVDMTKNLWDDKAVKKVWKENKNSMHNAHLDYYIENIDRVSSANYEPNNEDIVRCRQYTIGASTTTFYTEKYWWKIIDVGGQTPERAKWSAIVEGHKIASLLYFVALDEFDVDSTEEKGKTKLELSLKVWGEVAENNVFQGECILLFLNKMDVFKEAIASKSKFKFFRKRYSYEGEQDAEEVGNFIRDKFLESATESGLKEEHIFPLFTCAIEAEQMAFAWQSIFEHVLRKRVQTGGFEL